jgi:hypothetical protein
MAGLYAPLPTLRRRPRGRLRTDRGRRGLLLLPRSGLSPHTPCQSPGALTRVAACTLALSPIRDTLIEGFSHFVTSMTAPIASGWSDCRVGLSPTAKRRLCTAHATSGSRRCNHPNDAPNGKATRMALFNSTLMIVRRETNIDRFRGRPLINAAPAAAVCFVYSAG